MKKDVRKRRESKLTLEANSLYDLTIDSLVFVKTIDVTNGDYFTKIAKVTKVGNHTLRVATGETFSKKTGFEYGSSHSTTKGKRLEIRVSSPEERKEYYEELELIRKANFLNSIEFRLKSPELINRLYNELYTNE